MVEVGKEDIARVAMISSREREILGDVIADAIEKVGKDGVVNVEEGQTFGLELKLHVKGMQFDKGYLSLVPHHRRPAHGGRAARIRTS